MTLTDLSENSKSTILVVDDDMLISMILRRRLEQQGYSVLVANDGASGARMAMEHLPDLILLDKEMPGMHGFAVSRVLRRHAETASTPILMISAEDETSEIIRGYEEGVDDFIKKDIPPDELNSKIRAFLRIRELQDMLKQESDKLNQIFRLLHEPVAICNLQDKVVLASQVFRELLKMPPDVSKFKTMTEILKTLDVDDEVIEELLQGTKEEIRLTISLDDEVLYLTARTAPMKLANEDGALAYIFHDITKEVEVEKMKADFHSMIAHDLRSPMSVIQGYVSLMATGKTGPINETQSDFLDSVNRKITEMTSLLNDFLDMNKMDAGFVNLKCSSVNLGHVIDDVVTDLAPMASTKNLKVSTIFPENEVFIHSDSLRLIQILRNLLSNAIKYNKENGWIKVSVEPEGPFANISISDGGLGMSGDELKVLFDPYSRGATQRQIKGVGLGIVIVKKLVEAHGGQVSVTSKVDVGTTFKVSIPLELDHCTASEPEASKNDNEELVPVVN
jgi:signal transduction histidine kinase